MEEKELQAWIAMNIDRLIHQIGYYRKHNANKLKELEVELTYWEELKKQLIK